LGSTAVRDAALPAAICVLGVAEMAALRQPGWGYGAGLEVISCTLLIWRRHHAQVVAPLAVVVLTAMSWIGLQMNQASVPVLILTVAVYSLARWVPDLRGLLGVGVIAAAISLEYALADQRQHSWSDAIFVSVLIASPYVLGRVVRKLSEQGALLERQQEIVKQEAARAERDRIARELHDVIAHSVSAMVVQTTAAQDLVRSDPDRASEVLEEVASTGRQALAETGHLLHVIRDEADELGLQPAPGLGSLPELVERFRASGLEVTLEVNGPLRALPVGLDVSAYRITQEALTNALKYAVDRAVSLRLTRTPASLSIQASNTAGGTGEGSGLGLVGMAERVSLFGGRLTHGVNGDGRFEVTATLPVPAGVS
jgi:signal transduction histidine kinase